MSIGNSETQRNSNFLFGWRGLLVNIFGRVGGRRDRWECGLVGAGEPDGRGGQAEEGWQKARWGRDGGGQEGQKAVAGGGEGMWFQMWAARGKIDRRDQMGAVSVRWGGGTGDKMVEVSPWGGLPDRNGVQFSDGVPDRAWGSSH